MPVSWRLVFKWALPFGAALSLFGCASAPSRFSSGSYPGQVGSSPPSASEPGPISSAVPSGASPGPRLVTLDLPQQQPQDPPVDGAGDPPWTEPLFSKEYGKLVFEDVRQVFTAPMRWGEREWLIGGVTAAGIGALMFFDKDVSDFIERNHNSTTDKIASNVDPFGREYSWGVLGAFYVGGVVFHNPKARAVAQDGLAASLIAAGIISPALKYTLGRARHEENVGSVHFDPFKLNYNSFPSGHTTQAFAVASVIAAHYESYWIKGSAYGIATLVGAARIQRNRHWATDVAVGALIGATVGHTVVFYNQHKRAIYGEPKVAWTPFFDGEAGGVAMSYRF